MSHVRRWGNIPHGVNSKYKRGGNEGIKLKLTTLRKQFAFKRRENGCGKGKGGADEQERKKDKLQDETGGVWWE